ncbi:class I SAM-dependent methyltransferase [Nocardia sp. NPDC057440]|uniref:class I SAM-dependent methyltransferase n=1 Tax=Nocardia sp. NPDC057440 TaxID=3346134 RepID=UPI0036701C7B
MSCTISVRICRQNGRLLELEMTLDYLECLVNKVIEAGRSWEGSSDTAELASLARLARSADVKVIGEIGFNCGLSSYTFLDANPDVLVYSFDMVEFDYVVPAKQYIDEMYPGRHTLIPGNSTTSVPEFAFANPRLKFDLIFIDGGHSYEIAKSDLLNMKHFATEKTILVVDDITPWNYWGVGPTRAWQDAISAGMVSQEALFKDGVAVTAIEPPGNRSWVVGKYL